MIRRFLSTLFILLLAHTTFSQVKKAVHIVFIGNSITQGVGLQKAPPAYAIDELRRLKKNSEISWSNQGVSGFTTVNFLPETNTVFPKVEAAAREAKKDALLIFSIKLGTNDSAIEGPLGAPVSPEQYYKNMKTISDRLLADFPGCRIMYQHPVWYSENTYNGSKYLAEGLARLQSYFPEIDRLIAEYAGSHPGRVFQGDTKAFAYFKKHHETDFQHEEGQRGIFYLHPNEKGAKALGIFWAKAIARIVR